ncbi:NADH-quinone oxidoreductase subunit J [Exilibacterium tricleocarpae]|uniref:NADH-quinone oxidoreductase subunit J n=1 Tax=Exilibacterium tricleocarpae TaxID=2591008 RepID=A0A545T1U7_9GAMM|nr:NADH-quinone oxidoreductase subunit J [Exilibacterium tricleocarpae]TQV71181.1 NADH-quinone oxidoreductase subunit J [Exilibacterium tricleocarpae]
MTATLFYIAAAVAVISTVLAITRTNAAHALLYLVVSLLSVAVIFYLIGAPLAGALEVIVYAGAIMVLFVFVIMMLNAGRATARQEQQWLSTSAWTLPALLCAVLLAELVYVLQQQDTVYLDAHITPKEVGILLYGPYLLAVELASMLLLAGLVGAYHLGREDPPPDRRQPGTAEQTDA